MPPRALNPNLLDPNMPHPVLLLDVSDDANGFKSAELLVESSISEYDPFGGLHSKSEFSQTSSSPASALTLPYGRLHGHVDAVWLRQSFFNRVAFDRCMCQRE